MSTRTTSGGARAKSADHRGAAARQQRLSGDELTVAEARERYPDQWIVLAVTRQNRQGYATAGRVIAHTRDRTAAHTAVRQYWHQRTGGPLKLFYNGKITVPPGVELVL